MPVRPEPTPNPNALKFSVGKPVGGPSTFTTSDDIDDPLASSLLSIEGVTSVFMTADFVTVTKLADTDWDQITPAATTLLDEHFG